MDIAKRIRPRIARGLLAAVLVLLTLVPARSDDDAPRCVCVHREACYHFLNAPVPAADDPCPCAKCEQEARHTPGREIPDGWNAACMASNRMACFLERHAVSWKITCSECLAEDECCPFPAHASCPFCGDADHREPFEKDAMGKDPRAAMEKQLEIEKRYFDEKKVVVAYSRRFYVVTDIPKLRLARKDGGSPRWAKTHEIAHLMLQRAEQAYDELTDVLGGRVKLLRPMGIYLPDSERDARELQEVYFRAARTHMIYSSYGSASESAISEGFCLNGFCVSRERIKQSASAARSVAGDDYALHGSVRHLIAHVLTTCWIRRNGENRTMPRWAFVGAAQWFGKRYDKHRDVAYYCTGEDQKISGSTKDWREDLMEDAERGRLIPIEELLGASSLGHLDYEAHRQLWGYFEIALSSDDWRGPWIDLLADLRDEKNVREAFQERLGMSPEEFHEQWVARLMGKDIDDVPDTDDTGPMATDEPTEIAAAFRGWTKSTDPAQIAEMLDLMGVVRSDLVRETGLSVLLKLTDRDAVAAIRTKGLTSARPLTRVYALRAIRYRGMTEAKEDVRALLDDSHWLVRAEAALAAATLRDYDAQSGIRALTKDPSPKARIGAMDALATFGEDVNSTCLPLVAANLEHARWQVRLAAAQTLGRIGEIESVDALIARLEKEGGRVQEACFEALRTIAGEDLGNDIDRWKGWWKLERRHVVERGGFARTGPRPPPEVPGRYAPDDTPHYYGEKVFSQRVVFVLDTSRSTNRNFRPDRGTRERLLGDYGADTLKITEISAQELELGVAALDPRARFDVILFSDTVRRWKGDLVPASAGNKRGAASFVRSRAPNGETNFHAALLSALDLDDEDPWGSATLTDDRADTVTFLTDGSPTVGDLTDPEEFVRWFADLNRYSRARLHVIAFGQLGVNETFLERLAEGSLGTFTQLIESNPK